MWSSFALNSGIPSSYSYVNERRRIFASCASFRENWTTTAKRTKRKYLSEAMFSPQLYSFASPSTQKPKEGKVRQRTLRVSLQSRVSSVACFIARTSLFSRRDECVSRVRKYIHAREKIKYIRQTEERKNSCREENFYGSSRLIRHKGQKEIVFRVFNFFLKGKSIKFFF